MCIRDRDDDGRQPIAIGNPSFSGDLKTQKKKQTPKNSKYMNVEKVQIFCLKYVKLILLIQRGKQNKSPL